MPGIVDVACASMTLHHGEETDLAAVAKKVTGLGYIVSPVTAPAFGTCEGHHDQPTSEPWWRSRTGSAGHATSDKPHVNALRA